MNEIQQIVSAYHKAKKTSRRCVLATLVCVEGSSYRRQGARMLVTEDGTLTGAISGGCLETDILRKALLALEQGKNKLVTYDTSEEDPLLGVQLGCNGIVYILLEPLADTDPLNPVYLLENICLRRQDAVLVTLFSTTQKEQKGTCLLFRSNAVSGGIPEACRDALMPEVVAAFHNKKTALRTFDSGNGCDQVLIDFISRPLSIIVAGAGNDVQPLIQLCSVLGWNTTIIDGRKTHATRQRFPLAGNIIISAAQDILSNITVDQKTAVLLMTHNYDYDCKALSVFVATQAAYIGVLGPGKKFERMLADLAGQGIMISGKSLQRLHAPVGLDIGAETPEEIALSIVAEIKSFFSQKPATPLKNNRHFIHERILLSPLNE